MGTKDHNVVHAEDIGRLIAIWTGIPVDRLLEGEAEKLLHMEERLHNRVVGQDAAITRGVGRHSPRPRRTEKIPTGPSEASYSLDRPGWARPSSLAPSPNTFSTTSRTWCVWTCPSTWRSTPSRGSSARRAGYVGYDEGGQLTEAVRRRPFRVILFDEIEKAHPDVFNTLLQILEDGRLTDGHGRTVDFRNTLVIMTSNLGTSEASRRTAGFVTGSPQGESARLHASVDEALRRTFRPEFLNRLDDTIVFESLTSEQVRHIVELMLRDVESRLTEHDVAIALTDAAKDWLAEGGLRPDIRSATTAPRHTAAHREPAVQGHHRRRLHLRRHSARGRERRRPTIQQDRRINGQSSLTPTAPAPRLNIAAMCRRCILPVAVRGIVSIMYTRSGTLKPARCSPQ